MNITQGTVLHHNLDNKTYLVMEVTKKYITLIHPTHGMTTIRNNADTLQKFTLIDNNN